MGTNEEVTAETIKENLNSRMQQMGDLSKHVNGIKDKLEKMKEKVKPVDNKIIKINDKDARVTLTARGDVIITFVDFEEAQSYFSNFTKVS